MIMKVNEEMKKQGSEKEVVSLAKNADHVPFQQVPGQWPTYSKETRIASGCSPEETPESEAGIDVQTNHDSQE